jgi:putative spermidine/putrescine transport system substrate-binding protein
VTLYDNLAIPKGSKKLKAATAFLQYTARHATQSALTQRFPYGMGTVGATPTLDSASAGFFPDNFTKDLLLQNSTWWQANGPKVDQRWTETFAG